MSTVQEGAGGHAGWTLIGLQERDDADPLGPGVGVAPVEAYAFARRAAIFGANAPDPALLTGGEGQPLAPDPGPDWDGMGTPLAEGTTDVVELDGDQPRIVDGSWLVLERAEDNELYRVEATAPGGAARFALSGRITRVRVDSTKGLSQFGRRETIAHCESRELDVAEQPIEDPLGGRTLELEATDPPLPAGRTVLVTGFAPGTVPRIRSSPRRRRRRWPSRRSSHACVVTGATMIVTLDRDLVAEYDPATLRVRANVVAATHGETVSQVLGSGDATQALQRMVTRRGPLTYVGAADGVGVEEHARGARRRGGLGAGRVARRSRPGPSRVVTVRAREDGTVTVTAGDGVHGARLPTGTENVKATYRVGIGADGALVAGQLTLLPRRPLGIRGATNPGATHDWAAPEALTEARINAPLRIRTLDRAVSIADHGDFAAGFAGVGARPGRRRLGRARAGGGRLAAGAGRRGRGRRAAGRPDAPRSRRRVIRPAASSLCAARSSASGSGSSSPTIPPTSGPPSRPPWSPTCSRPTARRRWRWPDRWPSRACSSRCARRRASSPARCRAWSPVTSASGAPAVLAPDDTADEVLVALPGRLRGRGAARRAGARPRRRRRADRGDGAVSVAVEVGVTQVQAARERLLELLPVHHRARDLGPDGAPGPLTALLDAIAGELALLEQDLERLYDGWFVETCAEWLVPYLADLVGLPEVPPDLGRGRQPPGAGRQHRGLPPAQGHRGGARAGRARRHRLADPGRRVPPAARRDGARQPRAPRPRGASPALRDAATVELGAVQSPPAARGRARPAGVTPPTCAGSRRGAGATGSATSGHPALPGADLRRGRGRARGRSGSGCTSTRWAAPSRCSPCRAPRRRSSTWPTEPDLPLPLRPRRLLALLQAARRGELDAAELPLGVRLETDGTELAPDRIRVCRLESLAPGDEPQVMVDAVAGRLRTYREQAPFAPDDVFVRYAYGAMADVGAGTYDRSDVHDERARDGPAGPDRATTRTRARTSRSRWSSTLAAALDQAQADWADPAKHADRADGDGLDRRQRALPRRPRDRGPGRDTARARRRGCGRRGCCPTARCSPPVAGRYVPDGLRPHVQGTLTVTGGPGSSVVLDGLMLEGDVVVAARRPRLAHRGADDRDRRDPRRGGRRRGEREPAGAGHPQRRRRASRWPTPSR